MATEPDDWKTVEIADPRTIIPSLIPNARITSTSRSSDDPLSKRNPRSIHINNPNAFDMAPVPGMSFDDFKNHMKANGYDVIGGIDEVTNPSAWATGPHWHGELRRSKIDDWQDVTPRAQSTPQGAPVPQSAPELPMAQANLQDPLTQRLMQEQTPEVVERMKRDRAAGSALEEGPEGGFLERMGHALTTPIIPDELTRNDPTRLLPAIEGLLRVFGPASEELIRGTPLETLALASPLGSLEVGGAAALGRIPRTIAPRTQQFINNSIRNDRPLEEINEALRQAGETEQVTPQSYAAVNRFYKENPNASNVDVVPVGANENAVPGVNGRNQPEFEFGANDNQNAFGFEPPAELPRGQTVSPQTSAPAGPFRGANQNAPELADLERQFPQVLDNPDGGGRMARIPNPDTLDDTVSPKSAPVTDTELPDLPGYAEMLYEDVSPRGMNPFQKFLDTTVQSAADDLPKFGRDFNEAFDAYNKDFMNADLGASVDHLLRIRDKLEDNGINTSRYIDEPSPRVREEGPFSPDVEEEAFVLDFPGEKPSRFIYNTHQLRRPLAEEAIAQGRYDEVFDLLTGDDPAGIQKAADLLGVKLEKGNIQALQAARRGQRTGESLEPGAPIGSAPQGPRSSTPSSPVPGERRLMRVMEEGGGDGGEPPKITPAERLVKAIESSKRAWAKQETARRKERSARLDALTQTGRETSGREGFHQELANLKGPLPTRRGSNLSDFFSEEDVDGLFEQVKNFPDFESIWGPVNARQGLERLLSGQLPRPSEIKLLDQVFGSKTLKTLLDNREELGNSIGVNPRTSQLEMFPGEDILSTGPMRTLLPEPKPVDPERFIDDPLQGDLFKDKPKGPKRPLGQIEMFSKAETESTNPMMERPLLPEPKPIDPDKFVDDPYQGDFFKEKPKFDKGPRKGSKEKKAYSRAGSALDPLYNIMSLPRTLKSSFDLSGMGRQGLFMIGRPQYWKAFAEQFKTLRGGEKAFEAQQKAIEDLPDYELMKDNGLFFGGHKNELSQREEDFMSDLGQYIPGVHRSNLAYNAGLNNLRASTAQAILDNWKKSGVPVTDEEVKALMTYINTATGRGSLGHFNGAAPGLAQVLFSPRLMASRVKLLTASFDPRTYVPSSPAYIPPRVRKEYMKDLISFGTIASAVIALADAAGADVETDPRSSDFGKVRVGNTRYDLLGGFGQYLTLAARVLSGSTKTLKGKEVELGKGYGTPDEFDVGTKFLRGKLAPMVAYGVDMKTGENVIGEPFDITRDSIELVTPMFLNDLYDAYQDEGILGAAKTSPGVFGIGVQNFDPNVPKGKKAEAPPVPVSVGNMDAPEGFTGDDEVDDWVTVR